ncbi:outer membrane beta-barrel protein [Lichenibacterium dinghuense]|uniref:outer membrane beta-barrel protein n=1 Tax=Lichenibacterium dinghuense TaxID=2895977 RepID=UPI001F1605DF|nr:outer membrane beta-barrel protein [Lichenibacterium sp. 6Y81]
MSSTNRRPVGSTALLQAAGLAVVIAALPAGTRSASAQDAAGAASTSIPTLRGALDGGATALPGSGGPAAGRGADASGAGGDADGPNNPAPAIPADGGVGTNRTTANGPQQPEKPRGRFALPRSTAKTEDRLRYPRKGPPPLPELQAYPTSVAPSQRPRGAGGDAALALRGSGAAIDTVGDVIRPGPTVAALPFTARIRGRIEDAPYDPVGYEVGSLRLTPYVTQSIGYDSNPNQTQTGLRPSAFERTEGGVSLASTWSRNSFSASFHGGYDAFFSAPEANRPDAVGVADYRFDVDRDTTLDAETRFAIDTQRLGSPEVGVLSAVAANSTSRPLITTFGGSVGGAEGFGRLNVALHGSLDRTAYDNADGTGAGVVGSYLQNLASQNFNDAGLRLRTTYEVTPVLQPFVDLFGDERIHDHEIDYTGYRRDSTGFTGQVGSSFELTRLLTGELSAGYGFRDYQDPRLKLIASPVFNGAITYAATPLTTVSFRAATSFDETNVPGSSGTTSRSVTLEVSHALLRNTTITGALSFLNTDYVGVPITENTLAETLKAEYHLSRDLVATATYSHERLNSTLAGSSFGQNIALIGLRLQR